MGKRSEPEQQEAIRQSVHVDCPPDDAFRLFTEGFGDWWPLQPYSEGGPEAETCAIEPFVGGRLFERSRDGEEREWGEVTAWNPPKGIEFTWNPGGKRDDRQSVSVEFQTEADGTRVTLTHRGWEHAGVAVCVSGTSLSAVAMAGPVAVSGWSTGSVAGARVGLAAPLRSKQPEPSWAESMVRRFAAFAATHELAAV